jgi:hypothetical protein
VYASVLDSYNILLMMMLRIRMAAAAARQQQQQVVRTRFLKQEHTGGRRKVASRELFNVSCQAAARLFD